MRSISSAINRESELLDGHLREILRRTKDTSFSPRASPEGEVSVESKTKIQWETHPAKKYIVNSGRTSSVGRAL